MLDYINQISSVIEHGLPGEDAHIEVSPLGRIKSSEALKKSPDYKQSAVGVILFPFCGRVHLILIKRANYNGVHSGQISFPGGKKEMDDLNLEITALRECQEEIGIKPHELNLICQLTPVFIPVSNFLVTPFLFYLNFEPSLKIDQREVEESFSFDINIICKSESIQKKNILIRDNQYLENVPYFNINGKVVWGATALILNELRHILFKLK